MKLYFGGGEVPSHRQWLIDNNVQDVYLSYMGLRRRHKFTKPWLIKDKFPDTTNVMVDAGAFTVNKGVDLGTLSADELTGIATGYEAFISANIGRVDLFTEFDALPLGIDWINQRRDDFYSGYRDLCVFVWHAEFGLDVLEQMAQQYKHVGVLQTALGDRDIIPVLNMLAAKYNTKLHGLAMTKKSIMREVNWESVGSTSWTSPMRFGDTFVWTGRELKRYTKDMKANARQRHRTHFANMGFDNEKIMADDAQEIARLSLWSWQEFVKYINAHDRRQSLGKSGGQRESGNEVGEGESVPSAPTKREHVILPGISLKQQPDRVELSMRSENLRQCDSCYLATRNCPGYQAGAECVFELPLYIKTRQDIADVENALIAMQTQRVMFLRMVEDLEGGFADPNLSTEIDRLTRMIKMQREGTAEKFNLSISAQNMPGEPSLMKELFGDKVVEAQGIEGPREVDKLVESTEMFDAEIVENGKE